MQVITLLGRQPALGLAELESVFGAKAIQPLAGGAAIIDTGNADFDISHFGGIMKSARLITTLPSADWNKVEAYLEKELPAITNSLPEGKIRLGISTYGFTTNVRRLNATGLQLKKIVKNTGRSVRVVPNKESELNTAQVIHNQLTGPTGVELVLIHDGVQTIVGQTFDVQDIEAYAARDQARPKRDARVGMLPPKLAQIIINLSGTLPEQTVLLDPFCGTGVILQEAMLLGRHAYGTDLEPRMIEYSDVNLAWLRDKHQLTTEFDLAVGDATEYQWQTFDTIACETYLGRPFSTEPKPDVLKEVMQDVDTIHRKFFKNVAKQTKPGIRMCVAVPAWKTRSGFKHLKTLDSLEELGYTRVSFAHVSNEDLLYYREDQVVARELVVLTRK